MCHQKNRTMLSEYIHEFLPTKFPKKHSTNHDLNSRFVKTRIHKSLTQNFLKFYMRLSKLGENLKLPYQF